MKLLLKTLLISSVLSISTLSVQQAVDNTKSLQATGQIIQNTNTDLPYEN